MRKKNALKTKKNDLSSIFFFNISFIKTFNFNLNTLTIKLKHLKICSLDKRFFLISFQLKLQVKIMKRFDRSNFVNRATVF